MTQVYYTGKGRRKRRRANAGMPSGNKGSTRSNLSRSPPKSPEPNDAPEFETTGYGLLDVGKGRFHLEKFLKANPGRKVPVVLYAEIDYPFGSDDGTSIEFVLQINRMNVIKETLK